MSKKIVLILLCVSILISVFAVGVSAADGNVNSYPSIDIYLNDVKVGSFEAGLSAIMVYNYGDSCFLAGTDSNGGFSIYPVYTSPLGNNDLLSFPNGKLFTYFVLGNSSSALHYSLPVDGDVILIFGINEIPDNVIKIYSAENPFTISFNSNGGSDCEAILTDTLPYINNLPIPTKAGYIFNGWYYDDTLLNRCYGYSVASETNIVNNDITLYAGWVTEPPAFFGHASLDFTRYYINQDWGFNFNEVQVSYSDTDYHLSFNVRPNIKWYYKIDDVNYICTNLSTVRFDISHESLYSVVTIMNVAYPPRNLITPSVFTPGFNNKDIFYCYFPPSEIYHIITFDSNGGSAVPDVSFIDRVPSLPTPTKAGFVFGGWYSDEGLTTKVNAGDSFLTDITLYAKWYVTEPDLPDIDGEGVLRGLFTGIVEGMLTTYLTVGSQIGFGGITIISVVTTLCVILLIWFVIKIIKG